MNVEEGVEIKRGQYEYPLGTSLMSQAVEAKIEHPRDRQEYKDKDKRIE